MSQPFTACNKFCFAIFTNYVPLDGFFMTARTLKKYSKNHLIWEASKSLNMFVPYMTYHVLVTIVMTCKIFHFIVIAKSFRKNWKAQLLQVCCIQVNLFICFSLFLSRSYNLMSFLMIFLKAPWFILKHHTGWGKSHTTFKFEIPFFDHKIFYIDKNGNTNLFRDAKNP